MRANAAGRGAFARAVPEAVVAKPSPHQGHGWGAAYACARAVASVPALLRRMSKVARLRAPLPVNLDRKYKLCR